MATASAAVSKAPTIAPPPMAAIGSEKSSPARRFISRSISPVPKKKEGKKAPRAPPSIPPIRVPGPGAIAVPIAANALAPTKAVGTETAIDGRT